MQYFTVLLILAGVSAMMAAPGVRGRRGGNSGGGRPEYQFAQFLDLELRKFKHVAEQCEQQLLGGAQQGQQTTPSGKREAEDLDAILEDLELADDTAERIRRGGMGGGPGSGSGREPWGFIYQRYYEIVNEVLRFQACSSQVAMMQGGEGSTQMQNQETTTTTATTQAPTTQQLP